jgi:hypothetical protein
LSDRLVQLSNRLIQLSNWLVQLHDRHTELATKEGSPGLLITYQREKQVQASSPFTSLPCTSVRR